MNGLEGHLYFECHDGGDYDLSTRSIVNDTFLAGTVRKMGNHWVFLNITAGKAVPLYPMHYYFP